MQNKPSNVLKVQRISRPALRTATTPTRRMNIARRREVLNSASASMPMTRCCYHWKESACSVRAVMTSSWRILTEQLHVRGVLERCKANTFATGSFICSVRIGRKWHVTNSSVGTQSLGISQTQILACDINDEGLIPDAREVRSGAFRVVPARRRPPAKPTSSHSCDKHRSGTINGSEHHTLG